MKISYNWLRRYIETDLDVETIGQILTEIGLETEKIHRIGGVASGLEGVVVGKVMSCAAHPNADRLKLTTVDVGAEERLSIVCGAPNVAEGQHVLVATVGSTLHPIGGDAFKIKKSKIRGEVSMGMICAEDELGLGESHDGIMVLNEQHAPGTPAEAVVEMEVDYCIEIGLTPNRADAMSHYGVARDLHAALQFRGLKSHLSLPGIQTYQDVMAAHPMKLRVENEAACPHYLGLVIEGLEVKESPEWLKTALQAIDLKPINNVVDVTNFVLHEIGHPLHAFDLDAIRGMEVVVRNCAAETAFTTLDEKERRLHENDLMICNAEEPMCIAGVFGGMHSGVTESTKAIFLESAYFDPVHIRKTAKRHGLNTDASFRYERGIDPNMSLYAMKRAALLLAEIAGGKSTSRILEAGMRRFPPHPVEVSVSSMQALIGQAIDKEVILEILSLLDIRVTGDTGDQLRLEVPAYRVDVRQEADIVEEVLRIYGLDNIPIPEQVALRADPDELQDARRQQERVADALIAFGFQEVLHNSLHKGELYDETDRVDVLNPLSSDLNALRNDALFPGLDSVARNLKHRQANLKFFEFGRTYHRRNGRYFEKPFLAFWVCGEHRPENWDQQSRPADVFTLKEGLARVAGTLGLELRQREKEGKLELLVGKQRIGEVFAVPGGIRKKWEIDQQVFYACLEWDKLLNAAAQEAKTVREVPRYPGTRRDLALLVNENERFDRIEKLIQQAHPKWIREVGLFDVFQGKGIPEGKQSYAVRIQLQSDDKTLTDAEVDKLLKKILEKLQKELGAELRQ